MHKLLPDIFDSECHSIKGRFLSYLFARTGKDVENFDKYKLGHTIGKHVLSRKEYESAAGMLIDEHANTANGKFVIPGNAPFTKSDIQPTEPVVNELSKHIVRSYELKVGGEGTYRMMVSPIKS